MDQKEGLHWYQQKSGGAQPQRRMEAGVCEWAHGAGVVLAHWGIVKNKCGVGSNCQVFNTLGKRLSLWTLEQEKYHDKRYV